MFGTSELWQIKMRFVNNKQSKNNAKGIICKSHSGDFHQSSKQGWKHPIKQLTNGPKIETEQPEKPLYKFFSHFRNVFL